MGKAQAERSTVCIEAVDKRYSALFRFMADLCVRMFAHYIYTMLGHLPFLIRPLVVFSSFVKDGEVR